MIYYKIFIFISTSHFNRHQKPLVVFHFIFGCIFFLRFKHILLISNFNTNQLLISQNLSSITIILDYPTVTSPPNNLLFYIITTTFEQINSFLFSFSYSSHIFHCFLQWILFLFFQAEEIKSQKRDLLSQCCMRVVKVEIQIKISKKLSPSIWKEMKFVKNITLSYLGLKSYILFFILWTSHSPNIQIEAYKNKTSSSFLFVQFWAGL